MEISIPKYSRRNNPSSALGVLAILVSIILVFSAYFDHSTGSVEEYYVTTIEYDKCYAAGSKKRIEIVLEANNEKYTIAKPIWTQYSPDEWAVLKSLCRSTSGTIWLLSKDSRLIRGISTPTFKIDPSVGVEAEKSRRRVGLWMALFSFGIGIVLIVVGRLGTAAPYVHKQQSLDEVLPYVVRAPLWVKLLVSPSLIIFWAFFWPAPESYFVKAFREGNYLLLIMMLLVIAVVIVGALEAFVQKTIFHRQGIEHRSRIGITSFREYSAIDFVRFKATSLVRSKAPSLTIVFSDSYKITIFESLADLNSITQIIDRLAPERINHVIE
jgi:hypothetical protein